MTLDVSVLIPSWNGLHLLRKNLPSVLAAVDFFEKEMAARSEVLVVDDGSTDSTVARLESEFPRVQLIARQENGGFARACNSGFEATRHSIVALLNNDVQVRTDYLVHVASHFEDSELFAVTARVFELERPVFSAGGKVGRFRRGFWSAYFNYDVTTPQASHLISDRRLLSFYAVGGFAAYHREKLLRLGGFNELLSPFHWEDIDLSYRAWKRGWEIRYEPRAMAYHDASTTINTHFSQSKVERVATRNRILFHWINLHSPGFLLAHFSSLLVLSLTRFLVGDWNFYRALIDALGCLESARSCRAEERRQAVRSDREIRDQLRNFYRSNPIAVYYSRREVLENHPESG